MRELPQNSFFDGFYIWFNKEEKEEYYATPLYLYSTVRKDGADERKMYIELEKDITKVKPKNEVALKHPATIYIHYAESFGMLLVKLLNADFTTFESAYNTFFYAYGFELLKGNSEDFVLAGRHSSEEEMLKTLKSIYEDYLDKLLEIQSNYIACVDFVYNLNENEELKEYKANSKFIAHIITTDMYVYSSHIEVILDNYIMKHHMNQYERLHTLADKIENNDTSLELSNVYTSTYLSDICFVILDQLVKIENLPIKTCQHCGRYFIPTYRQNEIYCDFPNLDGSKPCREKGAAETYKRNLENIPALQEYRRTYQQKIMVVYRNKNDRQIKKDFDSWKKEAQGKIKLFKQGNLPEDELYKWMIENK